MQQAIKIHSPLTNMFTVWHALFLRETLDRFFGCRMGWAWLVFEPCIHVLMISVIFSYVRGRLTIGGDMVTWLMVGLLMFFLFRRTSIQAMHAVDCNRAFFMFRQVRPLDVVVCRSFAEAFAMFLVASLCAAGLACFGKNLVPTDPLLILGAAIGVWLLGLGYGLICAIIIRLVPESGHILNIIMLPFYFASGAIWPLYQIPAKYREYLLYNPIAHGLELARMGFFMPHYHHMNVNLLYVYVWAIALVFVGMGLFKLMEMRLMRL